MAQPRVAKKHESLGRRLYKLLAMEKELSQKEKAIIDILKTLLTLEDTEEIFSVEGQGYYIVNERTKTFAKVVSNFVSITTEANMISDVVCPEAIRQIEILIRDRAKANVEKLKSIWLERETEILSKVTEVVTGVNSSYEVISEVGKK